MTPQVTEERVPAYDIVKEKIKDIDHTVIIARVYYMFGTHTYRFQLMKKDKMCMVEIPKVLLDAIKNNNSTAVRELSSILAVYLNGSECWAEFEDSTKV
jgi:hypothetical protein